MKADQKKKVSNIICDLLMMEYQKSGSDRYFEDVAAVFFRRAGINSFKRKSVRRRLKPVPKDTKFKVHVQITKGPYRHSEQLWVILDRDFALKVLVLGFIPETITV